MRYEYNCLNTACENYEKPVDVYKPISEYDRVETCECCGEKLERTIRSLVSKSIDKTGSFYKSSSI